MLQREDNAGTDSKKINAQPNHLSVGFAFASPHTSKNSATVAPPPPPPHTAPPPPRERSRTYLHEAGDMYTADLAHPAQVIAQEVHNHQILCSILLRCRQLSSQLSIPNRVRRARSCSLARHNQII